MKEYSQEELIRLFECYFDEIISSDGSVGNLFLRGYNYPLPNSIVNTGNLNLINYNYILPNSIININCNIFLSNDYTLPKNLNIDKVQNIRYYI